MPDIQKSMKLSLAFGLSGAVILPVLYEVYAYRCVGGVCRS